MKCDKCSSQAVVYQKYSGMHLCTAHFQDDVHRKIRGTLRESGIFARGAKLAVAMNGSAESAVLIYVLKNLFSNRKDFELVAIMIDEGIAGFRHQALDCAIQLANELHIPFIVKHFKDAFGVTIDELHETRSTCHICKSMRKDLLNNTAEMVGANALAIGSNLDSEAAEIMAGYLSEDIEGLPDTPSCNRKEEFQLIKPLRRIPAKEVELYAKCFGIRFASVPCPYASGLLMDIKKELEGFEERHPGTNYALLRSLERMVELQPLAR